ncbi:Cytochrome c-type biogenesis protein Ccs1/ResB [Methylophaga frappieri]|uniref:Cytochrome c-type biogenesis protein Ccs1/ResB n=1 Tax=Methylophaga frappieri (strain ATCC BAA-2434 / DSM 25690 / JAM7) TaxID=754477 RepID=I1YIM2_METFJ|nr:Cytochrome c-type biogenesis protein Ccs1/ResB [Methylophaga frappieri]
MPFGKRLFAFLGSMDLAITLLLTLAIASVIGTVLQQNQPYTDYVLKFGPFWFEVFEQLGLYDVYSAGWFLLILTLLVISTGVCVIRHFPSMVRDMWQLRTQVQKKSLRLMPHHAQWSVRTPLETTTTTLRDVIKQTGYRSRLVEKQGGLLISAMRGGANRLGYLFTHIAIVVICLGGLIDGNLSLKLAELQGKIQIETRDLAIRDIPAQSRLPVGDKAFRGTVSIPEGKSADVVFLPVRDGYLLQALPFRIEVEEFRVEHYPNGQPKSFESDLRIHDPELAAPLEQTIAVNHPWIYKGHAIYQASFSDGGSHVSIKAWPLSGQSTTTGPASLDTKVFSTSEMQVGEQLFKLEMINFRPFNINPDPTEEDSDNLRNFGPSIGFKIRTETGEAQEFENYMFPVPRDGRNFFLSGVRNTPAEQFAYLYLPADENGQLEGFIAFNQALRNESVTSRIAGEMMRDALSVLPAANAELEQNLQSTLETLLSMFVRGGFDEVRRFIDDELPDSERDSLAPAYLGMLREMLSRIYFTEVAPDASIDDPDAMLFLQDAVDAIGILPRYGAPVFLQLTDFKHIESTGLQIAKAPGKNIVYFGCLLLVIGVFLQFYLPQRRFWLWVEPSENGSQILLAGSSNRRGRDFDEAFNQQHEKLLAATRTREL